jgi:hypothetical protein
MVGMPTGIAAKFHFAEFRSTFNLRSSCHDRNMDATAGQRFMGREFVPASWIGRMLVCFCLQFAGNRAAFVVMPMAGALIFARHIGGFCRISAAFATFCTSIHTAIRAVPVEAQISATSKSGENLCCRQNQDGERADHQCLGKTVTSVIDHAFAGHPERTGNPADSSYTRQLT